MEDGIRRLTVSLDDAGKVSSVSGYKSDANGNILWIDAYELLDKNYTLDYSMTLQALLVMDSVEHGTLYDSSKVRNRTFINGEGAPELAITVSSSGEITDIREFMTDANGAVASVIAYKLNATVMFANHTLEQIQNLRGHLWGDLKISRTFVDLEGSAK